MSSRCRIAVRSCVHTSMGCEITCNRLPVIDRSDPGRQVHLPGFTQSTHLRKTTSSLPWPAGHNPARAQNLQRQQQLSSDSFAVREQHLSQPASQQHTYRGCRRCSVEGGQRATPACTTATAEHSHAAIWSEPIALPRHTADDTLSQRRGLQRCKWWCRRTAKASPSTLTWLPTAS